MCAPGPVLARDKKAPDFVQGLSTKSSKELLCLLGSRGSGGCSRCFLARRSLDTSSLAAKFAQIIEPRSAHFALADHFNRADGWGVQRKNALDAHAKTHPAHGEGCSGGSAFLGDHHALKRLQALFFLLAVAFLQPHIDTDGVAWPEFGEIFAQLRFM